MKICEQLHITKGITAVIGSGGKTTLLRILAEELSGTVILTTSTHILPFAGIPLLVTDDIDQVRRALALHRVICMGTPAAEGKLTAPALPFSVLADAADYVIVEADAPNGCRSRHTPRMSRSYLRIHAKPCASWAHPGSESQSNKPYTDRNCSVHAPVHT